MKAKGPVRVKICGITNMPDALEAIRAGVDAMGFNLFPGSRRYVPVEEITWVGNLAGTAVRVAVMVNPSIEEIRRARPFFDVIQLHGQETAEMCAEAASTGTVWKAFPLAEDINAKAIAAYQTDALIIDSMTAGAFGGTGTLIDLEGAAKFVRACARRPVWLSGGLNAGNVARAVEMVRPYGVDVASGVEAEGNPRRKDRTKMREFVAAARQA